MAIVVCRGAGEAGAFALYLWEQGYEAKVERDRVEISSPDPGRTFSGSELYYAFQAQERERKYRRRPGRRVF